LPQINAKRLELMKSLMPGLKHAGVLMHPDNLAMPSVLRAMGEVAKAMDALLQMSRSAPIVFVNVTDPVGGDLVASLAGNATGFTGFGLDWISNISLEQNASDSASFQRGRGNFVVLRLEDGRDLCVLSGLGCEQGRARNTPGTLRPRSSHSSGAFLQPLRIHETARRSPATGRSCRQRISVSGRQPGREPALRGLNARLWLRPLRFMHASFLKSTIS
jgi:hypothetical protein